MFRSFTARRKIARMAMLALASASVAACNPIVPVAQPGVASSPSSVASAQAVAIPSASTTAPASSSAQQPTVIKGEFTYSNDIITTYYVETAVMLSDMYGFVKRDKAWEIPVESQVLGYLNIDQQRKRGTYDLQLPARPRGQHVDVDNNGKQDAGVQIFATGISGNLTGSPFEVGDDRSRGWPSYLASTVNDSENEDEVIGGKLIVWAPDSQQQFPTGFGADAKLFTQDDPVGPIPAGYSVVDLDQKPFAVTQEAQPQLTLHEPQDAAIKDFSGLSYTDAFNKMFDQIRKEYAFNGIAGKEPKWDDLKQQLQPRVVEAERNRDATAFYRAVRDFTLGFKDGHVGLNGGATAQELLQQRVASGYGFAVRELDDKRFIVTYVTKDGPAAKAGITVGAEVSSFNNKPIAQATSEVQPEGGPFSTDFAQRYQQQRYLLRAPVGTNATIGFTNPGGQPQTATLAAVEERESFAASSLRRNFDPAALPVEFRILPSGVGYVKVNSNYDDLNLVVRLFERALSTFEQNQLSGLIIDMRQNSGGAPLGLAGYLTDKEIALAQNEYYSEKTGKFEPEGLPDKVYPNQRQFRFPKMALMVDQSCYSACEIEAYGFSQVPDMVVIGQYPTAGVEAEVSRGQYALPEGMSLQVPTGRFVLPDGSIFLEGKGVQPTQRVPINQETVLSQDDVVLQAAEQAVSGQ